LGQKQRYPVYAVAGVCVVAYILGCITGIEKQISSGGLYSPAVFAGQYGRLITAMFIHLGIIHLVCNLYVLIKFGVFLADEFGGGRFLKVFFLAGFISSLGILFIEEPNVITVGASGALYGIEFYLLAWLMLQRKIDFNVLRPFLLWIIAGNFIISGVSVIGHASGAVAGAVLGFIDYSYDSIKQSIRKDSWRKYGIPDKRE